jgi:RNA polymerase sigma factor (sigma-70 family)
VTGDDKPGPTVSPKQADTSSPMKASEPGGTVVPGSRKGGGLRAGRSWEGVREEGTGAAELGPSDAEDLALCRVVRSEPWERGGAEAFWTLWRKHRDWVWCSVRKASRRMCPHHVAWEVFAEALLERVQLRLTRGAGHYQGDGSFRAFLKTTIVHASIDQRRYYQARREEPPEDDSFDPADPEGQIGGADAGPVYRTKAFPSPERVALARQRGEILHEALRVLGAASATSGHWAGALRRFYLEDMTGTAIAREMGWSLSAVHKYLERGRKELRAVLKKRFGIENLEDLIA